MYIIDWAYQAVQATGIPRANARLEINVVDRSKKRIELSVLITCPDDGPEYDEFREDLGELTQWWARTVRNDQVSEGIEIFQVDGTMMDVEPVFGMLNDREFGSTGQVGVIRFRAAIFYKDSISIDGNIVIV